MEIKDTPFLLVTDCLRLPESRGSRFWSHLSLSFLASLFSFDFIEFENDKG